MKHKKTKYFLVAFMCLLFGQVFAQEFELSGTIVDETGMLLPSASVSEKGTENGTQSDFDGNFSLTVTNSKATLVVSFVGFTTQEITVNGQSNISVTLLASATSLDEVVLIGYGSALKKDLTSSVAVVNMDELQRIQSPQIEQALGGKIAGVSITSPNAEPGSGFKIRIRGGNSLNGNNAPLLVIDGILGGDFTSLNVNEIESMQVLKDASATAIYGSRGANGVIIVATKKGKLGKINVDVISNVGFQTVRNKIPLYNAEGAIQVLEDNPDFDFPSDIDGILNPVLSGEGTDWQDEIFQTALYQNYHVNITGGSEKLKAFVSLDFFDQEGVVIESGYEKFSGRANLTYKISNKFSITNNLSYYKTNTAQVKTNGGFGSFGSPLTQAALYFSPIVPVYAEDGSFNGPLNSTSTRDNPVNIAKNSENISKVNFFQNTIAATWKITDNLTYDFSASIRNVTTNNRKYVSKTLLSALNVGEAEIGDMSHDSWQIRNTLNYTKSTGDHHFSILGGYEITENKRFRSAVKARGFATEALKYNNIGIASEVTSISSGYTEDGLVSYLARATYGYKSKYLASVSGRADGSTKFAKNNKWAYFPSASLAWVVSEEDFLANISAINFLKLRGSYGKSGSQAISQYQSLARYRTGLTYSLGGDDIINGVFVDRVANPNLKWETTTQYDIGLDLELFDSRLGFTYDYFNKKTDDLLFNKDLLAVTGISKQLQNIGSLDNRGHEFTIDAQIIDGKFKWDASVNITFINNKVTDLGGEESVFIKPVSGSRGSGFATAAVLQVGEAVGNFYGFVADGIYNDQAELDDSTQAGAQLGSVKYLDTNGDGIINNDDRTIIGNALPDYVFGMNNNFSYRNFDLNISIQGSQGNDVIWLDKGRINSPERLNGWTETNPDTNIPRGGNLGSETNSNYVEDASFIKFKNISLGYNFSEKTAKKIGAKNMRLSLSAIDAFVITDYSGFDPEVNSHDGGGNFNQNAALGFDAGSYPGVALFLFGLNITF